LLAATYTPSRSPASGMKQKFYSQVNMERIFFFEPDELRREQALADRACVLG
jgi:hypothetical protein